MSQYPQSQRAGPSQKGRAFQSQAADPLHMEYDPDQNPEIRRETQKGYRAIIAEQHVQVHNINNVSIEEMTDNLLKADELFKDVKNPQDAVLDSQFLQLASHMTAMKARSMKADAGGFDVDDFIAKLITFMGGREGGMANEDDAAPQEGTLLQWERIAYRGLAKSRRVVGLDFMLGPLSIEPKKRAQNKRNTFKKNKDAEVKPDELNEEDLQRSENETTKNVAMISEKLGEVGTVNIFRLVVNPDDFGQSVENLFYLSFLIRDGLVALDIQDGEPMVFACDAPDPEQYAGEDGLKKRQVIFELDMAVWKRAIETFNIKESMIPTRPPPKDGLKNGKWY